MNLSVLVTLRCPRHSTGFSHVWLHVKMAPSQSLQPNRTIRTTLGTKSASQCQRWALCRGCEKKTASFGIARSLFFESHLETSKQLRRLCTGKCYTSPDHFFSPLNSHFGWCIPVAHKLSLLHPSIGWVQRFLMDFEPIFGFPMVAFQRPIREAKKPRTDQCKC